jgi:hypothetical protein
MRGKITALQREILREKGLRGMKTEELRADDIPNVIIF